MTSAAATELTGNPHPDKVQTIMDEYTQALRDKTFRMHKTDPVQIFMYVGACLSAGLEEKEDMSAEEEPAGPYPDTLLLLPAALIGCPGHREEVLQAFSCHFSDLAGLAAGGQEEKATAKAEKLVSLGNGQATWGPLLVEAMNRHLGLLRGTIPGLKAGKEDRERWVGNAARLFGQFGIFREVFLKWKIPVTEGPALVEKHARP
ncbi:MAG: hypothetical protein M3O22_03170 [Pseudomonadota bacterium]|nr:hypothetical protein [Pseudomonadota bacterium]